MVLPEIIKSLQARIHDIPSVSSIHIQPADEFLTSELRAIHVDHGVLPLHTTFAWLGYGTIIHRTKAVEFLQLLDALDMSDEERKMSDNYFTILSNETPERWFDAGIPLGGGQPFTVGQEGEDRNNRHIVSCFARSSFAWIQYTVAWMLMSRVLHDLVACNGTAAVYIRNERGLPEQTIVHLN